MHESLIHLVVNVLMVQAAVKLYQTVKTCFSEGRGKVTFIIGTVLAVVITEIMGFWYRKVENERIDLATALIKALVAIRCSPERREQG